MCLVVASRNKFVDGGFFNNKVWVDAHEGELQTLFETVVDGHYVGRGEIVAFGELFGPGINKGVEYPDGRHFMLFDILVIEEFGLRHFLNWRNVEYYADVAELKTVPVLARGTLRECMNFKPEFKSVAGELVDPTFTSGDDNLAEGVVIRPDHTFYIGHDRAMLKVNIDKFKETISAPKEPKPDASKILLDYPGLLDYVTSARLDSVVSKEGDITSLNFGYVVQMFIMDAITDYCVDNSMVIGDSADMKALKKCLSRHPDVVSLVRRAFGYT